jgi:hypothetical protein
MMYYYYTAVTIYKQHDSSGVLQMNNIMVHGIISYQQMGWWLTTRRVPEAVLVDMGLVSCSYFPTST